MEVRHREEDEGECGKEKREEKRRGGSEGWVVGREDRWTAFGSFGLFRTNAVRSRLPIFPRPDFEAATVRFMSVDGKTTINSQIPAILLSLVTEEEKGKRVQRSSVRLGLALRVFQLTEKMGCRLTAGLSGYQMTDSPVSTIRGNVIEAQALLGRLERGLQPASRDSTLSSLSALLGLKARKIEQINVVLKSRKTYKIT